MKILLVNPKGSGSSSPTYIEGIYVVGGGRRYVNPPTPLMYLSGLVPPDDEVEIVDECIEAIDFDRPCDLVGVTANTRQAKRAYEIADEFRRRGRRVVMGGVHPSFMPDEAKAHADSVVIGEAEDTFPLLIEDAKKGELKPFYRPESPPVIEGRPLPRYDLIKFSRYRRLPVQTSRGCPYHCEFCSVWQLNGNKLRFKSFHEVRAEIEAMGMAAEAQHERINNLSFVDDNFAISTQRTVGFLRELIEYNKTAARPMRGWNAQSSIRIARNDEVLDLLHEAGCRALFVGLESISDETLKGFQKTYATVSEYDRWIEKIRARGFDLHPSFIIGTDNDDVSYFEKLADYIKARNFSFFLINIMTPLPGTGLFARLSGEGRMLHYDWSKYNAQHVVYRPKRMSAAELQQGLVWIYERLYEWSSMQSFLKHNYSPTAHEGRRGTVKGRLRHAPALFGLWFSDKDRKLGDLRHIMKILTSPEIHGRDYLYVGGRRQFLGMLKKHSDAYIDNVLKPLESGQPSKAA